MSLCKGSHSNGSVYGFKQPKQRRSTFWANLGVYSEDILSINTGSGVYYGQSVAVSGYITVNPAITSHQGGFN